MKKNLLLMASLFAGFFSSAQEVDANGYATVNVNMEPQYAKQVFYKLATNTQTPAAASSWDISFQRSPGGMAMGSIRVNDHKISAFYEASANIADWSTISVTNENTWTLLYNSETEWSVGAFDNGSDNTAQLGFGWGVYNMGTHHVNGTRIFVLKAGANNYKKIIIEDLNTQATGGPTYTFKHSTWDGTTWSADQTGVVVAPTNAPADFIYFSLDTNATVTVAPATAGWDFVFTKYFGLVTMGPEPTMYGVNGALLNTAAGVKVAAVDETREVATFTAPAATAYSSNINSIGDKWKVFGGGGYTIPEKAYYVKYDNGDIYRMYFLSFGGSATGALSFKYKKVNTTAGLEELNANISFGIYPNPSVDKNITLMYDLKNNVAEKNTVSIYSITGAKVFETQITNNSGFYTKELNLSSLTSGMYIVKMESGKYSATQKLIIQ